MREHELLIPRIASIEVRAVELPLATPVWTSLGRIRSTNLVLSELRTESGLIGRSYIRVYSRLALEPLRDLTAALAAGVMRLSVRETDAIWRPSTLFALDGRVGLHGLSVSAVDVCLWDLRMKSLGKSARQYFGTGGPEVRPYYSAATHSISATADEVGQAVAGGVQAVKIKLDGTRNQEERELVREVASTVGRSAALIVDFNQSLDLDRALRWIPTLEDLEVLWVEEPLPWNDYLGYSALTRRTSLPVVAGENASNARELDALVHVGGCQGLSLDLGRIGGITGWLSASSAFEGIAIASNHAYPDLANHLLRATGGGASGIWLESHDHLDAIRMKPKQNTPGFAPTDGHGLGLDWVEHRVSAHSISSVELHCGDLDLQRGSEPLGSSSPE